MGGSIIRYFPPQEHKPIVKAQALMRGHIERTVKERFRIRTRIVQRIQRWYRTRTEVAAMRRRIMGRISTYLSIAAQLQDKFERVWPSLREAKRIEVHLPSLSLPEDERCRCGVNVQLLQGEQFGRIAYRLLDPNVFVVFVVRRYSVLILC